MSRKNLIEYLYKEMCYHGFGDLEYWKYYFNDKEDSKEDIIEFIYVDINLFKKNLSNNFIDSLDKKILLEAIDANKLLLSLLSSLPPNLSQNI